MAKWDLSKLPEGRKPLPDEWFVERAQMQERIAELETQLAKALAELERLGFDFQCIVGRELKGQDDE